MVSQLSHHSEFVRARGASDGTQACGRRRIIHTHTLPAMLLRGYCKNFSDWLQSCLRLESLRIAGSEFRVGPWRKFAGAAYAVPRGPEVKEPTLEV